MTDLLYWVQDNGILSASLIQAIHDSGPGHFVRDISWMFAALETAHFIGLCLLFGSLLVTDLRLAGFFRTGSVKSILPFTYLALAGFSINLISGAGFFASNPDNYNRNPFFWIKMILVLLAGINLAIFELVERRKIRLLPDGADTDTMTKTVAISSLLLWTGVIIMGRLLPLMGVG